MASGCPQIPPAWSDPSILAYRSSDLSYPAKALDLPDADITLYPRFLDLAESDALFQELLETIGWKQETIRLFGKPVEIPRLTAWYGEAGAAYTYSGLTVDPQPWTQVLLSIRARIEPVAGARFNSVLLNLYRSERDSVAWHSDDEPELGENPLIASVSLGATRRFGLRHKMRRELRHTLELPPDSLLVMRGPTQHYWQHQVPKSARPAGPRINLTFRVIRPV